MIHTIMIGYKINQGFQFLDLDDNQIQIIINGCEVDAGEFFWFTAVDQYREYIDVYETMLIKIPGKWIYPHFTDDEYEVEIGVKE